MSDEWWVMSDGNWVTEIEWWFFVVQTGPKQSRLYENYGLKSVVKTYVYNIHKVKNMFDTMFQITYFSVWKNIIVCLLCVCVCFFFFKKRLIDALRIMVNNPFKESLYGKKKKLIFWQFFPFSIKVVSKLS